MATKTKAKTPQQAEETGKKLVAFRLASETIDQLAALADALQGGNQTATLREIIRQAHRREFGK